MIASEGAVSAASLTVSMNAFALSSMSQHSGMFDDAKLERKRLQRESQPIFERISHDTVREI